MNRSLPPGDCGRGSTAASGASRGARPLPGTGGLVGGVAAPAGEPTIGPLYATLGPRSNGQRGVGVSGKAAATEPRDARLALEQKSPPEPGPVGQERKESRPRVDAVVAGARFGFERLD